jgi:hypothetical protein
MAKWMRVERTPRSIRRELISELTHNVLVMIPGISNVCVLTESSAAAAMSYVCVGREPFDVIDRKLHAVDIVRTPPFDNVPDPASVKLPDLPGPFAWFSRR